MKGRLLPCDSARSLTHREHRMDGLVLSQDGSRKQKGRQGSGFSPQRGSSTWAKPWESWNQLVRGTPWLSTWCQAGDRKVSPKHRVLVVQRTRPP